MGDNIVVLNDENGAEVKFEFLDLCKQSLWIIPNSLFDIC